MLLFVGYGMLGLAGFFAIYLQAMDAKKKGDSKDKKCKKFTLKSKKVRDIHLSENNSCEKWKSLYLF